MFKFPYNVYGTQYTLLLFYWEFRFEIIKIILFFFNLLQKRYYSIEMNCSPRSTLDTHWFVYFCYCAHFIHIHLHSQRFEDISFMNVLNSEFKIWNYMYTKSIFGFFVRWSIYSMYNLFSFLQQLRHIHIYISYLICM